MATDVADLLADLAAETADLDDVIGPLAVERWEDPTPAVGWTIRDQITHLAYFDQAATLAADDPQRFRTEAADLMALGDGFPDRIAERYRGMPAVDVLRWFRRARRAFLDTLVAVEPRSRLPWYGPDMSVASCVTARLMETWAHGQDVADALHTIRQPTERLRHIAHLGVLTREFCYRLRGLPPPHDEVRVELVAPGGRVWTWGPEGADNTVTGSALDFCLVVVQRRNLADTALRVTGDGATQWMSIAQAYAGAPGRGRAPLGSVDEKP